MSCTPTRSDFRGPVARSGELPRRFAAPASRKDCRQSLTEGVRPGVGSLIGPLEPRNAEAGPARPASASCGEPQFATLHFRNVRAGRRPARSDVSEESRSNARGSCRIGAGLVSRVAPAVSGPAGFPSLAFAVLESFTSERAAARPALTSPKRAAVMRVAPAAEEPVSFPKWPPPHRGPLGLPHSASGRGASSITLYAVDRVTSLKIVQVSLGVVIPAFETLLAQSRSG